MLRTLGRTSRAALRVLLISIAVAACAQQTQHRVVVNADIVKMAQAGLADDTIIAAIEGSKTNFDISPDALISLAKAKVPQTVIQTMIHAGKAGPNRSAPPKPAAADRFSDDFSLAGLRALSAIRGELGRPDIRNGGVSVPRHTQELIDDVDAIARTPDEKRIVSALNRFYMTRLSNNISREIFKMRQPFYGDTAELKASEAMAEDPGMQKLAAQESSCADPLEEQLRSRNPATVPSFCAGTLTPPAGTVDTASSPADAETIALLHKVFDKLGSREDLARLHGYHEVTRAGADVTISFPDSVRLVVGSGAAKRVIVLTPAKATTTIGKQTVNLPQTLRDEGRRLAGMNMYSLAAAIDTPDIKVFSAPDEPAVGKIAKILILRRGADTVKWFVDPNTDLILEIERQGLLTDGTSGDTKQMLRNWRSVDNVLVPFETVSIGGDGLSTTIDIASFAFNPPGLEALDR